MKRIFKRVGITLACVAGSLALVVGGVFVKNAVDARRPWLEDGYWTKFRSGSALEEKYSGLGGFEVSSVSMDSGDEAMGRIRVWHPAELEDAGRRYPLVIVVNASNMAALNYEAYFARLASWGFVVAGNDDRQAGSGRSASLTLERLLELDGDPSSIFHGRIDGERVGVVGYSQGGAGAINAATAFENSHRFKALFTGSAAYSSP